jgi:hypothetical protein
VACAQLQQQHSLSDAFVAQHPGTRLLQVRRSAACVSSACCLDVRMKAAVAAAAVDLVCSPSCARSFVSLSRSARRTCHQPHLNSSW